MPQQHQIMNAFSKTRCERLFCPFDFRAPIKVLLIVLICSWAGGCRYRPNWGSPGTIGEQRQRAVLHDPYPSTTLGPSIESGRPLGFDRPLSEPTATQSSPYAKRGARNQPYGGF